MWLFDNTSKGKNQHLLKLFHHSMRSKKTRNIDFSLCRWQQYGFTKLIFFQPTVLHGFIMIYTRRYSYKRVLEGSNDQIFPVSLPEYERCYSEGGGVGGSPAENILKGLKTLLMNITKYK